MCCKVTWDYFPLGYIVLPLKTVQGGKKFSNCASKAVGVFSIILFLVYLNLLRNDIGSISDKKISINQHTHNKDMRYDYGQIHDIEEYQVNEDSD